MNPRFFSLWSKVLDIYVLEWVVVALHSKLFSMLDTETSTAENFANKIFNRVSAQVNRFLRQAVFPPSWEMSFGKFRKMINSIVSKIPPS